ncbi:MAG TPA: ATP-grasp domain-containing protein [Thermodesulforhabdus norvegica]|uniref:ATP-grasp domain-containing protein n=1 Tax=Thermodesulforhabdus norvegica TaxID=39841 RepID=A0A7C0WS32_9BACT|nr:ATP-grasp domain-containing protein [Thermodesulforhabdus norvegica]
MRKCSPEVVNVALGKRLRTCRSISCIGVLPNFEDYDFESRLLIEKAGKVYYPSAIYEPLFDSLGKATFPKNYYTFVGNKIKQTLLFEWCGVNHPKTRIVYGRRKEEKILKEFEYPFIAKNPVGSSQGKGVFLIRHEGELRRYLEKHDPAYVQEYLPTDRDLRVVIFAGRVINAYWRIGKPGEFRHNVSQGATISFDNIPEDAIDFALDVVRRCGFGEVGLDVLPYNGEYYVIEANMVYGMEGFRCRGLDVYVMFKRAEREGWL